MATEAYRGRFSQVHRWSAIKQRMTIALAEAEVGETADAKRLSTEVVLDPHNRQQRQEFALLLARLGEGKQAGGLADATDKEAPRDTLLQKFSLPTIRAAIQLNENHPATAIELLRPAVKYELAFSQYHFDNLYPAYIRGLAYLQLGRGREAAAEFQKLIDHPAIVKINVIGALARLQLGRSQVLMGDRTAARRSYQDFLSIWKDADPKIPIFKQAKAEYARLGP